MSCSCSQISIVCKQTLSIPDHTEICAHFCALDCMHLTYLLKNAQNDPQARVSCVTWCRPHDLQIFSVWRHWASLITLISVLNFVHLVACTYVLQIFCLQTLSIPDQTEICGSLCTWLHAFKLSTAKCSAGSSSQSFSCKLVQCAWSPFFFLVDTEPAAQDIHGYIHVLQFLL